MMHCFAREVEIVVTMFIILMKEETKYCSPAYYGTLATSYVPVFAAIGGGMYLVAKYQKQHPSRVLLGDVDFSSFTLDSSVSSAQRANGTCWVKGGSGPFE